MLVFHLLQKPYERKCLDTFVSHLCQPLLFQFILFHCTIALFFHIIYIQYMCVCLCAYVHMWVSRATLSRPYHTCSDIIYRMLILRSCSFYPYVLPNCTPCTIVLIVKTVNFFAISIRVFNSGQYLASFSLLSYVLALLFRVCIYVSLFRYPQVFFIISSAISIDIPCRYARVVLLLPILFKQIKQIIQII